jgi:hypothetical protein
MEMPKPTAEHERLAKLAGTWKGEETMHPSQWEPEGGVAQAVTKSRVALDGFAVVSDYEQSRHGQRSFAGHGVYTWDAEKGEVVLHWFDSMGTGVDVFRGKWDGERLQMLCRNAMGHWRFSYDCSAEGKLTSRMEMSPDGKSWKAMFDGKYRREG